jgi:hypothetical protein
MSIISIEDIKPLGTKVISELGKNREPVEEFKKVVTLVDSVVQGASFSDLKAAEYFFGDFLGIISKTALKTYHFADHEVSFHPYS